MAAVFHDRILADDAEVAHAVFHIRDDVRGLREHGLDLPVSDGQNQPAALLAHLRAVEADPLEGGDCVTFQPALREGDSQRLHAFPSNPISSTSRMPRRAA